MHRLLLTSATYRQASRPTGRAWTPRQTAAARESWQLAKRQNPDNELLARMPRHQLEGEAIRDAILAAADDLNQRRGGRGIRPPLPKELLVTLLKKQWPITADVQDHRRRSTYLFVRRNLRFPIFEVFDKPDTNASCPRRNRSTIAAQALMLLNFELSLSAARAFAAYIFLNAEPNTRARINLCYLRALGREPTDRERNLAATFLADDAAPLQQAVRTNDEIVAARLKASHVNRFEFAAMTDLCLSLFNLNEFIYID
ncbi:MAG: DUF1553 domain-containing protein [Planctomycetota bacterium]|nr:DUF1553 domain-containing protein [Planctomycetota bacterium]